MSIEEAREEMAAAKVSDILSEAKLKFSSNEVTSAASAVVCCH